MMKMKEFNTKKLEKKSKCQTQLFKLNYCSNNYKREKEKNYYDKKKTYNQDNKRLVTFSSGNLKLFFANFKTDILIRRNKFL